MNATANETCHYSKILLNSAIPVNSSFKDTPMCGKDGHRERSVVKLSGNEAKLLKKDRKSRFKEIMFFN